MRFLAGITVAALSGLAAAASSRPSPDVFILQAKQQHPDLSSPSPPSIPKEVARHILLQRTSRDPYGSDLRDIPSAVGIETAVNFITQFGKSPAPLFSASEASDASQLVVILEGTTAENAGQLKEALVKANPASGAFSISDPPSATANQRLMTLFRNQGIAAAAQCDIASAINPFNSACWTGKSSVVKYDVQKSPETIHTLLDNLSRLLKFTAAGDLEAVLVFLPESSRTSKLNNWSALAAGDLRRRQETETVLVSSSEEETISTPAAAAAAAAASTQAPSSSRAAAGTAKAIPQCFGTFNSCMTQTANCTGHGKCVDKYGPAAGKSHCFTCACLATIVETGDEPGSRGRKTVHWGGNVCQKKDISVPFWLLTGFTIVLVGAITFAIGLLYSIGEEPLPGVIGAGVIRASK
ncbi:hypothetical protein B0T22DRAFT_476259 [Podospora appendiculata]|uniref:Vacuolar sorting protein Vps3844 C-terminal domain-containing protein n=1 Tax=Podospora appendiculata TaxID=314037 RepID=A0AAE0XI56_9PEZI|nr:hypothetical protein B0T22DRAFT_476259 [Podospora appendiculata]